jgi:20S proteasome alpha/beta subunit
MPRPTCLHRYITNHPILYSTAIGLRVKDGVVLAVEKLVQSKLLVEGANRRIQSADLHIGIVSIHNL